MKKRRLKKKALFMAILLFLLVIGCMAFFLYNATNKPKKDSSEDDVYVTISFDVDGGSSVESERIKKGSKILLPESTKEGFSLVGWFNGKNEVSNKTRYEEDTTLKAKWEEAKTFKVTFDSKGGSKVEPIIAVCGKRLGLPEEPTKNGYSFMGWKDKSDKEITDGEILACEDITLIANWEQEKGGYYTISFDSKGGSKVDSIKEECGKSITFPKNPTKDGYNFVAWKDKDGKDVLYESFQACESMTLYAEWESKSTPTPTPVITVAPTMTPTPTPVITPTPTPAPDITPAPSSTVTNCPEGQELKDGKCVSIETSN